MITERDLYVTMSDGVRLAFCIHRPDGAGPFPTLFAASPYRYDNDDLPETSMFLWRETGPIKWYVEQGYAYVRMDVRGSGRSEGDYSLFNARERRDLYEAIEWIAAQSWSNGKVGGIGQSYYAISQWCAAAEAPPHLACIAPYDGHYDFYHCAVYAGGVPGEFASTWWDTNVRPINLHPANGAPPRRIPYDLVYDISLHPTYDAFWQERSILDRLRAVTIPVYSIGAWAKLDLHLNGNIVAYQQVAGPKKLHISGAPHVFAVCAEFATPAFHERMLLPFYDHYLKGKATDYPQRPDVSYVLRGAGTMVADTTWPPPAARFEAVYLRKGPGNGVPSLNDGALDFAGPDAVGEPTSYSYPDRQWAIGVAALSPTGPDPLRRILVFTSPPLAGDMTIAGPSELVLFAKSTARNTDFVVRVSEQGDTAAAVVTKGWLRASHRQVDPARSRTGSPALVHDTEVPLEPGHIYEFRIPLMPMAYRFRKGARIRIELANGDSRATDPIFSHSYTPDKVGTDTIYHDAEHPSRLLLPVMPAD